MMYALIAFMGLGLIDSYFISFLGTTELAAIGFIVPITAIIQNIGLGLGMAISSLTSKLIGADKTASAARLITNGFYLTAAVSLVVVLILCTQLKSIFILIGADSIVMPNILEYMQIWLFAAPLLMLMMVCSSTFRAIGDTATSAKIAIVMTAVNLILDPILIFGIGPFPRLGMQGAAIATVLAVVTACSLGLYELGVREKLLLWAKPRWHDLKESLNALLEIAIPAVLANSIVPISAAILTTFVATFGNDVIAGYGVSTRVESVCMIIVYALSSTLPMFIGQNLGAGNTQRIYQATQITIRFIVALQLVIYLLLMLFAQPIAELFSQNAIVQDTIRTYFWIVPLSYGLSGVIVLINVAMNVLGQPKLALYINILRLFLFYIPFAYLGGQWFAITGLFIGVAIANACAFIVAMMLLNRTFTNLGINPDK